MEHDGAQRHGKQQSVGSTASMHSHRPLDLFIMFPKINGREIPGPLLDFGILMYHNGRIMAEVEAGPFFYLSKVESALEARLWDQIFTWSENQLGLRFGT